MRWLWLSIMLLATVTQGSSLEQLLSDDKLRLRSWLTPDTGIVPGQEVQLTIEISTRRWFAGGTRIRLPEVRGLVVLQRDMFATNLSQREKAVTWVVQRWHLELYPQGAGSFSVPPIELELAVNDASAGIVQGQLHTEPTVFEARIPTLLEPAESWIATPSFKLSEQVDPAPEEMQAGDAFTREVVFSAANLTAMMLPALDPGSPEGLAAYPDSPKLLDRSNRGEALAERRERIVYVVETPGQYQLPEQVFYWWNTTTGSLGLATLPAITVDAGVGLATPVGAGESGTSRMALPRPEPQWLALPLLLLLVYALYRLRQLRTGQYRERQLLRRIERELRSGKEQQAVLSLYQWLNSSRPEPDWYRLRRAVSQRGSDEMTERVSRLVESVYAARNTAGPVSMDTRKLAAPGELAAKIRRVLLAPVKLQLNPGSTEQRPTGGNQPR